MYSDVNYAGYLLTNPDCECSDFLIGSQQGPGSYVPGRSPFPLLFFPFGYSDGPDLILGEQLSA
jgi:hypothetical protein